MADADYQRCKHSITCFTNDLAVVHCLRALCEFAITGVKPQIGWGGTKAKEWRDAGNRITLRFTTPESRNKFIQEAERLLPKGSWAEVARSDNDPASRQRSKRVKSPQM
jgi:hypothetical protein